MNKIKFSLFGLTVLLFAFNAYAAPAFVRNEARYLISDLVERFQPSVVNISVEEVSKAKQTNYNSKNPFAKRSSDDKILENQSVEQKIQAKKHFSLGSGVIISKDGFVITNYHVVELASKITVKTIESKSYIAKLVGHDEKTDIALLKIDSEESFPFVKLGDSDKVRVGELVVAAGNPYGLEGSISSGIISARNRNLGSNIYDDFLQTDASINPGNSGGPLFNVEAEVVGINTAIFSKGGGSDGIGFAIPSNTVKLIVSQLKKHGKVVRGWLGIEVQKVDARIANALNLDSKHGVLVTGVVRNSPASLAGVKDGDVIIKYNQKSIETLFDLPKMVAETTINSEIKLTVFRNGQEVDLDTKIISTQEAETIEANNLSVNAVNIKGLYISQINANLKSDFRLAVDKGLVVVGVDKSIKSDVKPGDVILQINQQNVKNIKEMIDIAEFSKEKSLLLFINRNGTNIFTVVGGHFSEAK